MPTVTEALTTVGALLRDSDTLVRATASGRRRGTDNPWRRAELRYVDLKAGRQLQVTTYDRTQAHTRNLEPAELGPAVDELLALPWATWHVESRDGGGVAVTSLRLTKKGDALLHRRTEDRPPVTHREHDRAKARVIPADDPLLRALDISDAQGRVKPSRQAKLRQVEEFCRLLGPAVDALLPRRAESRPLRIADLGCGNAYLTFAAWRYLTGVRGLDVAMVGVDLKSQALERNQRIAAELGAGDSLTFVQGTIADTELSVRPEVVLALHACDTATDDALARALGWRAEVVLAAPCCHHDLQRRLTAATPPEGYRLLTRHGILRERFADTLTDAFRAALLRLHGYRVDVVEFVESRHTPRNTLLRAVRTDSTSGTGVRTDYDALVAQWGVEPRLAELVGPAP